MANNKHMQFLIAIFLVFLMAASVSAAASESAETGFFGTYWSSIKTMLGIDGVKNIITGNAVEDVTGDAAKYNKYETKKGGKYYQLVERVPDVRQGRYYTDGLGNDITGNAAKYVQDGGQQGKYYNLTKINGIRAVKYLPMTGRAIEDVTGDASATAPDTTNACKIHENCGKQSNKGCIKLKCTSFNAITEPVGRISNRCVGEGYIGHWFEDANRIKEYYTIPCSTFSDSFSWPDDVQCMRIDNVKSACRTKTTSPPPNPCNNNGRCEANLGETAANCQKDCTQSSSPKACNKNEDCTMDQLCDTAASKCMNVVGLTAPQKKYEGAKNKCENRDTVLHWFDLGDGRNPYLRVKCDRFEYLGKKLGWVEIKCSGGACIIPTTTPPPPCNNNGRCEANLGETAANCQKDCTQSSSPKACNKNEDCTMDQLCDTAASKCMNVVGLTAPQKKYEGAKNKCENRDTVLHWFDLGDGRNPYLRVKCDRFEYLGKKLGWVEVKCDKGVCITPPPQPSCASNCTAVGATMCAGSKYITECKKVGENCYQWSQPASSCTPTGGCTPCSYGCENGACKPAPQCKPKTCADLGNVCGTPDDGCGAKLSCACPAGQICNAGYKCEPAAQPKEGAVMEVTVEKGTLPAKEGAVMEVSVEKGTAAVPEAKSGAVMEVSVVKGQ